MPSMPLRTSGVEVDSLLARFTYEFPRRRVGEVESEIQIVSLASVSRRLDGLDQTMGVAVAVSARPSSAVTLSEVARGTEGDADIVGLGGVGGFSTSVVEMLMSLPLAEREFAYRDLVRTTAYRRLLSTAAYRDLLAGSYRVLSLSMTSPLVVVLALSSPGLGYALLRLIERIETSKARVSAKKQQYLRDQKLAERDQKVAEREQRLIEDGKLDMALQLLRGTPLPDSVDVVGKDEDFDSADLVPAELDSGPES
jgi:hypothetical protein